MNGGLYPAEEINNSYQTMEGKLMPLPHPMVDGKYVSANDPRAINSYHVGAWAQNVSKSGDQVVMDVYINKAVAETKPDGKRLINRLDEMIAGTKQRPDPPVYRLTHEQREKVRRVEAEEVLMDRSQYAVRPYRYPAR